MTVSQNTLQLSGLQVRLYSMMCELAEMFLFVLFIKYNCTVYAMTQHLQASAESHGWSPCSKSSSVYAFWNWFACYWKIKKKTKTLIIKELVNLFYGTTVWTSGTFTSSRSFGVIVFLFGLYFLFQIFSKAFDSQDGKQLEESESTPSLLEQVQVGFYRCILMNYQWRDFLNSDRFELSNKNIFLLSLFNMSFCLVGVFLL